MVNGCCSGSAYLAGGFRSAPPCGASLVLTAYCRYVFLLGLQKEPKRSPLLPIARTWRRTTSAAIPQRPPMRADDEHRPLQYGGRGI